MIQSVIQSVHSVDKHGQQVAEILSRLGHEPVLHAAAHLLFIVKDTDDFESAIIARQAEQILQLATQLRHLLDAPKYSGKNIRDATAQIEQLRRMVLAMASDLRGVLIALASQLVYLRTCVNHQTQPDAGILQEVLHVFSPLANRLGVWQLKWELEDLAFKFSYPEPYQRISNALNAKHEERQQLIETVCLRLSTEFISAHIHAKIYGRPKHIYSIANKMALKNLPFESLYDLRAVRIIVSTIRDCYTALGIVHDVYLPIAKEFDDYIARPKSNGYQSLHTVIIADDGKPIEVQIRTDAMHEFAEFGVAAHWRYKEGIKNKVSTEQAKVTWLRQLLIWKKDLSKVNSKHWQGVSDHIQDETTIFCLTPAGRVIELIKGSTPIDFAYLVHTDLGHRCRGAKVNGVIVPLNTPLHSGQTVEILLDKHPDAGPSRDWLNPHLGYIAGHRTKSKVRAWFNALEHHMALNQGRIVIDRELARLGKTANNTSVGLLQLAKQMGYQDTQALLIAANKSNFNTRTIELAVHAGKEPSKLADKLEDNSPEQVDFLVKNRIQAATIRAKQSKSKAVQSNSAVWVVGVDMLLTQLSQCCKPVPPDTIIGYITRGKGISLHRKNCGSVRNLALKSPERIVECTWNPQSTDVNKHEQYAVSIKLTAIDRPGLLRDISDMCMKHKRHITALNTYNKKGQAHFSFSVMINHIEQLNLVLIGLREIKGVISANRY